MHTRAWERGITTTYGYTNGRLSSVDYSDTTPDLAYTFDQLGRTGKRGQESGWRGKG